MRLSEHEILAIKTSAAEVFGPDAVVRVFGSRVDDTARGGDIDLHLEVAEGRQDVVHAASFRWALFGRMDERELDLVFQVHGHPSRPIDRMAIAQGVVL